MRDVDARRRRRERHRSRVATSDARRARRLARRARRLFRRSGVVLDLDLAALEVVREVVRSLVANPSVSESLGLVVVRVGSRRYPATYQLVGQVASAMEKIRPAGIRYVVESGRRSRCLGAATIPRVSSGDFP